MEAVEHIDDLERRDAFLRSMADRHRGDADAAAAVRDAWAATLPGTCTDDARSWWREWPEPCPWHVNG